MGKISGKEIANLIGKTPSAISYIKKTNPEEYKMTRLGAKCMKFDITEEDLDVLITMKKIGIEPIDLKA